MNTNYKEDLKVSEGEELSSLVKYSTEHSKIGQDLTYEIPKGNNIFPELEEILESEPILRDKNISNIDSIEYSQSDNFFSEIYIKTLNSLKINHNLVKKDEIIIEQQENSTDYSISERNPEISEDKNIPIEKKEQISNDSEETLEVLEDSDKLEIDDTASLIEKINKEKDFVEFPGKINLVLIDTSLTNPQIDEEEKEEQFEDEEVLGIKKSEVFDTINKKINSSRSSVTKDISKIKNLKNGFLLPGLVVVASLLVILVSVPILSIYFEKTSSAKLEENFISDSSILEKIAKQKEEEAKLAKLKLEEEKRNLEIERSKMEGKVNETLLKRQAEIEAEYAKKLAELERRGLPEKEFLISKKQLDQEKEQALAAAKLERDKRFEEQQVILQQKDKDLKEASDKLKKALENKEFEVTKLTQDLEGKLKEKDIEKENITLKLKEISENNRKTKEFNQLVYQLIISSLNDFKNGNREGSLSKLSNVVKYYDSRLEFVSTNEDLKNKMETDLLFVQAVTKLIEDAKSASTTYSDDIVKVINKFKKISEIYRNAESYYNQKDWTKSIDSYSKVLNEIEEVNSSYTKIKDVEKQIQNVKALDYYNNALKNMKQEKYDLALNQLSAIIKEMPTSDYSSQALNDIVSLSSTMSNETKTTKVNQDAKELFTKASQLEQNKFYKDAIDSYNQIILNYPSSTYTKDALSSSQRLIYFLNEEGLKQIDYNLRENFKLDYNKFLEAFQKSDFKSAREFYFNALKNSFNIYTDNSIPTFRDVEEKYIASLLESSGKAGTEVFSKQLADLKATLEKQYNEELDKQKKLISSKYEDDIAKMKDEFEKEKLKLLQEKKDLEENYKKLLADTASNLEKQEINKLKNFYEDEITKKDKEIDNLNTQINSLNNDYSTQLSSKSKEIQDKDNLITAKIKEIQDKDSQITTKIKEIGDKDREISDRLKEISDRDKQITEKNKELENFALLKKQLEEKENELKAEKENLNKVKQELVDLSKKLNELEEKLKVAGKEDVAKLSQQLSDLQVKYSGLEKELVETRNNVEIKRAEIEEFYKKQKNIEVEQEKQKLREDFVKELSKLKNEKLVSDEMDKNKKQEDSYQVVRFIGRIVELIDDSMTFQFLSIEIVKTINKNDKLKIIRFVQEGKEKKEVEIGEVQLTFTDPNSLFGRVKIISIKENASIQVNDLLKK